MSLTEYEKKRSFNKTPGPTGGKPSDSKLHFVIQKHQASHLHYDFRLELRGILKSWPCPKVLQWIHPKNRWRGHREERE